VKNNAAERRTSNPLRCSVLSGWKYTVTTVFKGGNMKKVFALVILSICMTAPSFAKDVVGHSAKVAGKDTAKAAKGTAKGTTKAAKGTAKGTAKVLGKLF
jgi:hypothetical protein